MLNIYTQFNKFYIFCVKLQISKNINVLSHGCRLENENNYKNITLLINNLFLNKFNLYGFK